MKKISWILLILLLIILLLFWLCNIKKPSLAKSEPPSWRTYIKIDSNYKHIPGDSTQQIIILRKPGDGDGFLNSWLYSIHEKTKKEIKISLLCGTCADTNFMLLTGEGVKTFIQSSGGKGGGATCTNPPTANCSGGPGGGGDTLYWCVNFPVEFKDSANTNEYIDSSERYENPDQQKPFGNLRGQPIPATLTGGNEITVAVFDTGVDTVDLKNYLYKSNTDNCLNLSANNGWNFPDKNDKFWDNYSHSRVGHGQVVAHLIVDQVRHYNTTNRIKILPVKIHNSNGEGDLFSVLCGIAYAKERKANIINASFGYYAVKNTANSSITDSSALLIKNFIKYYLTDNNIWLIAAAGNRNSADNDQSLKDLYIKAGLPIPANFRNLDSINFYPASLASDPELPNVIAVTTVSRVRGLVSPNENYSSKVVDIGVNGDREIDDDFWFKNKRISRSYVRGSSYATPVVAGILCAHFDEIAANVSDPFNKNKVLPFLLRTPIGRPVDIRFKDKIKQGIMFNKALP